MPSTLDVLLPSQANNDYKGGRVPFYVFLFWMGIGHSSWVLAQRPSMGVMLNP